MNGAKKAKLSNGAKESSDSDSSDDEAPAKVQPLYQLAPVNPCKAPLPWEFGRNSWAF